jgi:hypothetical protein
MRKTREQLQAEYVARMQSTRGPSLSVFSDDTGRYQLRGDVVHDTQRGESEEAR